MWPKPIYKVSQSLSIQPYNFRASDQQIIIFGYKLIIYFVEIQILVRSTSVTRNSVNFYSVGSPSDPAESMA